MSTTKCGEFCKKCGTGMEFVIIEELQRKKCPSCAFIEYDSPGTVSVCIISGRTKPNSIVLVKRGIHPVGKWCMPAGWPNTNETPQQGAVRESKEESGLDVVVPEVPKRILPTGRNQNLNFFQATEVTGDMAPGSDATDVQEFTKDEVAGIEIAFPLHKQVIDEYFAELEAAAK